MDDVPIPTYFICIHTTYINVSRLGKIIKHMQEAKSLSNEEEATQSYLLGGTAIGKKHSVPFKK